jgi:hypothetical protein
MNEAAVLVVHGFAVNSLIFKPLLSSLRRRSLLVTLFRYPSIGLSLQCITERLANRLRENPPDAIIAHSLGCMAASLAVRDTGWAGPIVLLAPPFSTLPATLIIPRVLRWPFAPLLDHRSLTSASSYRPPELDGCATKTIVARFDYAVPNRCSTHPSIDEFCVMAHTHNSLLFSSAVSSQSADWVVNRISANHRLQRSP